jgi:hypothetical protein
VAVESGLCAVSGGRRSEWRKIHDGDHVAAWQGRLEVAIASDARITRANWRVFIHWLEARVNGVGVLESLVCIHLISIAMDDIHTFPPRTRSEEACLLRCLGWYGCPCRKLGSVGALLLQCHPMTRVPAPAFQARPERSNLETVRGTMMHRGFVSEASCSLLRAVVA